MDALGGVFLAVFSHPQVYKKPSAPRRVKSPAAVSRRGCTQSSLCFSFFPRPLLVSTDQALNQLGTFS